MKRSIGLIGINCILLLSLVISGAAAKKETAVFGGTTIYLPTLSNDHYVPSKESIFGLQMYGNTSTSSPYHSYLIDSRASWLRVNLSWKSVEPVNVNPENFDWDKTDENLSAARQDMGNINIIANVESNPDWAAVHENGTINTEHLGAFAQFMEALVERYDGDGVNDAPGSPKVDYWEIYNEPDRSLSPPRWGNEGDQYAQMLQVIYPFIKGANPDAKVVMGGIAYDWFEEDGGPFNRLFLNDVLAAGGGSYIDIMNFHSYPSFAQNWTGLAGSTGVVAKTNAIRSLMNQYGLNVPIIITEAGFHDNNVVGAPSSPEIQSRYLVTLFVESMVADIDVMIWWLLYDVGGFYPFDNGLVTNSASPIQEKLSYDVYQNLVKELLLAQYESTLSNSVTGSSDAVVHKFNDDANGRFVYATWNQVVTSNAAVMVKIPAASATVRDSVTNSTYQVTDGADGVVDGFVKVAVSGRPLFVEVNK